jgi:16S rRNA (uracil1498-N3)-methyltransferase
MRLTRIYQPGEFTPGEIIPLSEAASQHVGRVLRMEIGDNVTLFNGNNFECLSKIVTINKREVSVVIETRTYLSRESSLTINLAQGISKGDKMDFVIQKAIELGVTNIIPILSERCVVNLSQERMSKKHKQWQDQTISACEQCGRNFIPKIFEPCKITNFLENCNSSNKFVLSPTAPNSWHSYTNIEKEVTILIGPEGGLSSQEVELAEKFNFNPINLGPRILRTETAAITTISIIQTLFGDI